MSFNKVGKTAGETAIKILSGTDPASIKISSQDLVDHMYDWRQLNRWGLAGSDLIPGNSRIMYEETNFFEKFRLIIITAFLFLILQSLMIANLVRLNRKQKRVTKHLTESENRFRELINEDRILRLSQLMSSLSHELNQPLTAILSTSQAGIRFIDSNNLNPALLRELFNNIAEDDKRTAAILSSIRNMMKLEKREKERVSLDELVAEVIGIYKSELVNKNIRLEFRQTGDPVYIIADRIQIQQVLMNLILNAIQSVTLSNKQFKYIGISQSTDQDHVNVSIKDNGEGILESAKDRLFKPFVTSKKKAQVLDWPSAFPSLKIITERSRLRMLLRAEQFFRLHLKNVRMNRALLKIFIIDDDDSVRRSLSVLLKSAGFITESFADARDFFMKEPNNEAGCIIRSYILPEKAIYP